MFRNAAIRAVRTFAAPKIVASRVALPRAVVSNRPAVALGLPRFYSAPASLTEEQIEGRILSLLKGFDKVSSEQLAGL